MNISEAYRKGRRGVSITSSQQEKIKEFYPFICNQELATKLGICKKTVEIYAKKMGLRKNKHYMHEMYSKNGRKSWIARVEKYKDDPDNLSPIKKGQILSEGLSEDEMKAYRKRQSDVKKELYRKERMRIRFGLPQKTKLKVVHQPNAKAGFKYRLKQKGYIIDENGIAFYNSDTNRSQQMESRDQLWFKFKAI